MQSGTNSLFEEQNFADSLYTLSEKVGRRVLTAPAGPLSELGKFKRDKEFMLLEQFVIACNQLIHKSYEKYDIESEEGQMAFRKYLEHLEALFPAYNAVTCPRSYRNSFSKAYSTLYNEGEMCYLTEIWDSAQEAFLFLWVNGEKYPFSQQVLLLGSRLVSDNFKLQHVIKGAYVRILDETPQPLQLIKSEVKSVLEEFDTCWTLYEERYIRELMSVEQQAKSIIIRAIELERTLSTQEISNKLKFRFGNKSPLYYETRNKLILQISKINSVANDEGKGRDDLHPDILVEAEGLLRRVTLQQSRAVRVLAQKIKSSFCQIRKILRKYDTCIQQIDPQLKNNQDLVEALTQYQACWQKGKAYFIDPDKLRTYIDFTNVIQTASEKYQTFKQHLECRDSSIFMVIPELIVLKTLDDEFTFFVEYFLNQNSPTVKQMFSDLKEQFGVWKMSHKEHYLYFNSVEKELMGLEMTQEEVQVCGQDLTFQGIVSKIKQLAINLQRTSPVDWNYLVESALIDS